MGDVLRRLDDLKRNRSVDPSGAVPPQVRNALAKQQLKVAITDLDESTPDFSKAIADIVALDAKLQGPVESADHGITLVDNLNCFVKTLDSLLATRH
jgi:hypothetical protein